MDDVLTLLKFFNLSSPNYNLYLRYLNLLILPHYGRTLWRKKILHYWSISFFIFYTTGWTFFSTLLVDIVLHYWLSKFLHYWLIFSTLLVNSTLLVRFFLHYWSISTLLVKFYTTGSNRAYVISFRKCRGNGQIWFFFFVSEISWYKKKLKKGHNSINSLTSMLNLEKLSTIH